MLLYSVSCEYPGRHIVIFHVNEDATNFWFSVLIEYGDGDGDVQVVDLKHANSNTWQGMQ